MTDNAWDWLAIAGNAASLVWCLFWAAFYEIRGPDVAIWMICVYIALQSIELTLAKDRPR